VFWGQSEFKRMISFSHTCQPHPVQDNRSFTPLFSSPWQRNRGSQQK